MRQEELKISVTQICRRSALMQKLLFQVLDAVTVRTWHVKRELKKWIKRAPRRSHVLDAGAGVGLFSYWLSSNNPDFSVLALDTCKEHVCNGNKFVRELKRTNLHFKSQCISEFKANEAFDLVLCSQVLEYLEQDTQTLANFYSVLRPDGTIIATVKTKYKTELSESDYKQGIFRCGYDMTHLKKVVKDAGFKKVKAHFIGGKFGKAAEKIGFLIPISMLKFSKLSFAILPFYFLIALPLSMLFNWLDSHSPHSEGQGIVLVAMK